MPVFTGTLRDIGLDALIGTEPVLVFTVSEAAVAPDGTVISTKPVRVSPSASGDFSVELSRVDNLVPDVYVQLSIQWLSLEDSLTVGFTAVDWPTWRLRPGPDSGGIASILDSSTSNSGLIYVGIEPPTVSGFAWWIDISGEKPVLKKSGGQ